jgi:ATPases of the AAA+ class
MRYYHIVFNSNSEQIKKNSKVKLNDYNFDAPVAAVNSFMYRKMNKDLSFTAYKEEGNSLSAVFSFDETKRSYVNVYDEIIDLLYDTFKIKALSETSEITIHQFFDCVLEARKRECLGVSLRTIVEDAKLWIYDYEYINNDHMVRFTFDERIIPEETDIKGYLLDDTFKKELANIEKNAGDFSINDNIVHYIFPTHSSQAVEDMAVMLGHSLLKAKRISGRRVEIIREIEPQCYKSQLMPIEKIIENNYGGIVIFELTEKFGSNPIDYQMMCQYIEKMVKKHCSKCLFIFAYDMDHPGFSYYLLPNLKNYLIPVTLKEGSGNRKEAVNHLRGLINTSEYAEYAEQAEEFMMQYEGDTFTQTDVLRAYEKFGPWCLIKNKFSAYNYDINDDFMLERDLSEENPYEKLQKMIGLKTVKKQIDGIIAADLVEKVRKTKRGGHYTSRTMHMMFRGDPGTAKTTVARLFAGIAKDKGVLKSGAFVGVGGMDLCGMFFVDDIRNAFKAAEGGVLFIDEAYSMKGDNPISVLIQEMENHREDVIVIFAGYSNKMNEFMKRNEGLKSRIPYIIDFPNYTAEELSDIFSLMLEERGFTATKEAKLAAHNIFEKMAHIDDYGNGRFVRNLLDDSIQNQSLRLYNEGKNLDDISKNKLFKIIKDDISEIAEEHNDIRVPGTAQKELDEMIGLTNAKALIRKAVAFFKLRKHYLEKGISQERASMHMIFTGNPGSAKTTVARLTAEILRDNKILPVGQFVEVGRADIVGAFQGHTAKIVQEKFRDAQGGVLFIDEAYSLCDGVEKGYGDEAIDTIVKEMENHREDVVVIFAGYPEPMQEFLDRNPGMKSRIAFHVQFEDYSTDELCDITRLMVSKRQMKITDEAMDKLRQIYDCECVFKDYGNGRFVRKILDEAQMNLAERVMRSDCNNVSDDYIITIVAEDIPENKGENNQSKVPIGFAV